MSKFNIFHLLLTIFYLLLTVCIFSMTSEEYWIALNKRANQIYGGLDLALTVNVGNYYDNSESEFRSGVGFSIPIYSKQQKISRRNAKIKYLQDGSDLISNLKKNRKLLLLLKDKKEALQAFIGDNGASDIKSYFQTEEELLDLHLTIESIERKIETMLQ
ncbi:MAG: hypothetical protein WBG30_13200 [Psychrilyobacter sp.]|uniref:hypothetical protein n=1 Tax=Psychrilyobacter sp. TaxID=2586924 RepID=UPI003C753407